MRPLRWLFFPLLFIIAGCPHPLPPGPGPVLFDAGPADIFTGYTAKCGHNVVANQHDMALVVVPRCLEIVGDISPCLVKLADSLDRDTIVCTIVDLNVALQRKVASGKATEDEQRSAHAGNDWLYRKQVSVRR